MGKSTLGWDEIEHVAEEIWRGQHELIWVKKAWCGIVKVGLANYTNDIEKQFVLIRLLTLAAIFKEFYDISFEQLFELNSVVLSDWVDDMKISPFRIGQIVGSDFEIDYEDHDNDLLYEAINHLVAENKQDVFDSITKEFGDKSMLFLWLWLTVRQTDIENPYVNIDDEMSYDGYYDIADIVEFSDNGNDLILYEKIIKENFNNVFIGNVFDNPDKFIAYSWVERNGML